MITTDRLGRVLDHIERWMAGTAILLLVLITLSVCLEIVMRYFFNRPQVWVVELTEYALLYITFLGAAWVLKTDGHVQVNLLVSRLGERWQRRFKIFSSLVGLLVSLTLTVFGAIVTWDHYLRGVYKPTLLEFPSWLVLISIPLGSLFLTTRFFVRFWASLSRLGSQDAQGES